MSRSAASTIRASVTCMQFVTDLLCLILLPPLLAVLGVLEIVYPLYDRVELPLPIREGIAGVLFVSAIYMVLHALQKERSVKRLRNLLTGLTMLIDASPKWQRHLILQAFLVALSHSRSRSVDLAVYIFSIDGSSKSTELLCQFPNEVQAHSRFLAATEIAAAHFLSETAEAIYVSDTAHPVATMLQRGSDAEILTNIDVSFVRGENPQFRSVLWVATTLGHDRNCKKILALVSNRNNFMDDALIDTAKIGFAFICPLLSFHEIKSSASEAQPSEMPSQSDPVTTPKLESISIPVRKKKAFIVGALVFSAIVSIVMIASDSWEQESERD